MVELGSCGLTYGTGCHHEHVFSELINLRSADPARTYPPPHLTTRRKIDDADPGLDQDLAAWYAADTARPRLSLDNHDGEVEEHLPPRTAEILHRRRWTEYG